MRSSRASSSAAVPNRAGRKSAGVASAIAPLAERVIVAARAAAIERQQRIAAPGNQVATAVVRVNWAVAATAAVAATEAAPIKASIAAEVLPEVPANGVAQAARVAAVVAQEAVAVAQEVAAVVADAVGKKK